MAIQLAPWPQGWADAAYLSVLLPFWSQLTARVVGAVQGSISAALLLLTLVALVAVVVWPGGRRRLGRAVGWVVAGLMLSFPLSFGLGYRTTPLEAGRAPLDEALYAPAREEVVNVLIASAGARGTEPAGADVAAHAAACVTQAAASLRETGSAKVPERYKLVPEGWLLRWGFAGFVFPWLLEPHVDAALPLAARTAVALHELAHTAGFAREAEAEAVGMLAGLYCDDAELRYAAALRVGAALAGRLGAEERAAYLARWPRGAVDDLRAASEASAAYRSAGLARVAERAYDAYLVSQGTAAGVGDYDRGTELLVRLLATRLEGEGPSP